MAQITLTPIIEGTLARASEVMGNFQAIADVVNGDLDGSNIQDSSITSAKIVDEAVTNSKLAVDSVDSPQLVNGSVTKDKLGTLSVTGTKIASGAIDAFKIVDLAVTTPKLRNLAVTTAKLDNRAVTGPKLDDGAVGTAKIEGFAVTNPKLGDNAVNDRVLATDSVLEEHIKNGEVTSDKIGSIDASKISSGTIHPARLPTIPLYLMPDVIRFQQISTGSVNLFGSLIYGQLPSGVNVSRTSTGRYQFTHPTVAIGGWTAVVTPSGGLNCFPRMVLNPDKIIVDFVNLDGQLINTNFTFVLTRNILIP